MDFSQYQIPEKQDEFFNKDLMNQLSAGEFPADVRFRGRTAVALGPDITVGADGIFYTMRLGGIFNFGDGSDGDVTISVNTTLTADKYYDNLIVNEGVTLTPAGYRIFVRDRCDILGTIAGNGNAGGAGGDVSGSTGGTAGTAGTALADGYLKGSLAGQAGGVGGNTSNPGTNGNNGVGTSNSIGSNGSNGGGTFDTSGGTGGTATASNVSLTAGWHLQTLLDVGATGAPVKFNNSASAGSGGGASGTGSRGGGGGGGSGTAGRIVAIYAKELNVAKTGSITANGGNGGKGGDVLSADGNGGGGGGGGNGGQIILVYNRLVNNGSVTASAGTGGAIGAGAGTGASGTAGSDGSAGTIRQFEVSL